MTEQDYQVLAAMSIAVWQFIGAIRTPILHPIYERLLVFKNGAQLYSYFVWVLAFTLGFGAAVAAGDNGDLLEALGWWPGHLETFGWAFTAGTIACGSAGLGFIEKFIEKFAEKTANDKI